MGFIMRTINIFIDDVRAFIYHLSENHFSDEK